MTIASQAGEFSFALQPGKIGKYGTFTETDLEYYKLRVNRVSFGAVDGLQIFPRQVGAPLTATGAYKDSIFSAGGMDTIPPLKEIFGILLAGALGSVTTSTDEDAFGTGVTGLNAHKFTFAADPYYLPWLSVRRMVPGRVSAENSGETGIDVRVGSMRFTIPARGKLQCRTSLQGLDVKFGDASIWAYQNSVHENDLSTADAGRGYMKIGGVEYPITGAVIDFMNGLTSPRDEGVVGNFRPDDTIPLTRDMTVRVFYKYENDDWCRQIYTGNPDGIDWSSLPFYTEVVGSEKGFEAYFQSPGNVTGLSVPYGIRFTADRVVWQMEGQPELAGGSFVQIALVGTILQPDSGEFMSITLENDSAGALYVPAAVHTMSFAPTKAYTTGDAVLDATATLTNVGISDWRRGKVSLGWNPVTAGSLSALDSFSVSTAGSFTIASGILSHSATPVGTIVGGTYGNNLVISLNASATTAIVQDLLKALSYGRTTNSDSTTVFNATLIVQDSAGNTITDTIAITHS